MWDFEKLINGYLETYMEESADLRNLYAKLEYNNINSLINRKSFDGHFTASAYVIDKNSKEVLLIHHKSLNIFLQPGGHIEASDKTPLEAAKRELFEETGIKASLLNYNSLSPFNELIPFNISIHLIPENIKVEEASHYHFDLQYLFSCDKKPNINIDENEATSYTWVSWNDFKNIPRFESVFNKIDKVLEID